MIHSMISRNFFEQQNWYFGHQQILQNNTKFLKEKLTSKCENFQFSLDFPFKYPSSTIENLKTVGFCISINSNFWVLTEKIQTDLSTAAMGNLWPFKLFSLALLEPLKYAYFIEKTTISVEMSLFWPSTWHFSINLALELIWVAHGWSTK